MNMATFKKVKLGDVVAFRTGKLNSNAAVKNGAYPFFTCSQEIFKIDTFSFDTECVLLGGNNASAIYPLFYFNGKFDAYQRTYIIESKNDTNIRFFYYILRKKLEELRKQSTGATTKFLTLKILQNLDIKIPDIHTQARIASILSAYDDLIENNQKRIKVLEEMAQRLYTEWFVKFKFPGHEKVKMVDSGSEYGLIPNEWGVRRLGDVIELAYGKALKEDVRKTGSVLVCGSGGIVGTHNEKLVDGPGIVVGRKGNAGTVFWVDTDFYPIDTAYFVRTELNLIFSFYLLKHQNFVLGDAAVPGLNREQVYRNQMLVPPSYLIDEFAKKAETVRTNIGKIIGVNDNLSKTRDLLISQLVAGKREIE